MASGDVTRNSESTALLRDTPSGLTGENPPGTLLFTGQDRAARSAAQLKPLIEKASQVGACVVIALPSASLVAASASSPPLPNTSCSVPSGGACAEHSAREARKLALFTPGLTTLFHPLCLTHCSKETRQSALTVAAHHENFVREGFGDSLSTAASARPVDTLTARVYRDCLNAWSEVASSPRGTLHPALRLLSVALEGSIGRSIVIDEATLPTPLTISWECHTCSCPTLYATLMKEWDGKDLLVLQGIIQRLNSATPPPRIPHGTCACDCEKCKRTRQLTCHCCFFREREQQQQRLKANPSPASSSSLCSSSPPLPAALPPPSLPVFVVPHAAVPAATVRTAWGGCRQGTKLPPTTLGRARRLTCLGAVAWSPVSRRTPP